MDTKISKSYTSCSITEGLSLFPIVAVRDLQLMMLLSMFLHLPNGDENLLLVDPDQTALEEADQRDVGTALSHRQ